MNCENLESYNGNLLKGTEFAPGSFENPSQGGGGVPNQTPSPLPARQQDKEPLSKEREAELEAWMSEVKSFIRSIDINNL